MLHAAPGAGATRHWLVPDNKLALWAFEAAHALEATEKLNTALAAQPPAEHGLIEVMQGNTILWPPHTAVQQEVQPGIWTEMYSGEAIVDWENDCYLDLIAALRAWNGGDTTEAQQLYTEALDKFDNTGCRRPESTSSYFMRDLALAIFTGARIGAPVDEKPHRCPVSAPNALWWLYHRVHCRRPAR